MKYSQFIVVVRGKVHSWNSSSSHSAARQDRPTLLQRARRAGDQLTGCDPPVRKSLRPKGSISLGDRGVMWRADLQWCVCVCVCVKSCSMASETSWLKTKNAGGTARSLLLVTLWVANESKTFLTYCFMTHWQLKVHIPHDWYTHRSVSFSAHCRGRTRPEGCHIKATWLTPGSPGATSQDWEEAFIFSS